GEGQHIDLAQVEGGIVCLSESMISYAANGEILGRMGNRSRHEAPHGVFPCAGKDRWVAIAVHDDEDWGRLVRAMGEPAWATDADRVPELFRGAGTRDQHARRPRIGDLRGAGEHVPQRDGLVEEVDRLAGPQEDLRAHLKDPNAALVLLALGARLRLTSVPAI